MQASLASRHEPAGIENRQSSVLYILEHETQCIPIHASHARSVAFGHISYVHQRNSYGQIWFNIPILYIAATFVKYCYTTGS